ncbi:MAG: hypothetical protein WCV83_00775 [Candidatus Magasanikbacteria bacterium]
MIFKKNIIKIFFILFIIFGFNLNISLAYSKSEIGDTCTEWASNDECEVGANHDCQESTLPKQNNEPQYFCTCYNPLIGKNSCNEQYNPPKDGGNWKCSSGNALSYNLSYCQSTNGEDIEFPVPVGQIPYFCLGFNPNTNQIECAPVPTNNGCSAFLNSNYIPKQFYTIKEYTKPDNFNLCTQEKQTVMAGKFCVAKSGTTCLSNSLGTTCSPTDKLFSSFNECLASFKNLPCTNNTQCKTGQKCLENKCQDNLYDSNKTCVADSDCILNGKPGLCISTTINLGPMGGGSNTIKSCQYTQDTWLASQGVPTIPCEGKICKKSDKSCKNSSECANLGGVGICQDGFCWFDEISMQKYNSLPKLAGITADLQIKKPVLEINIPQLKFSDVQNNIDSEGYLHLPYIGEYVTAIYKLAMVIVSIIGVVMIIVVGIKITVLGGEERVNGFKKIGQIVVGLIIAWGSYTILYNINPDLVNFSTLKVEYIKPEPMPPDDIDYSDQMTGAEGTPQGILGACDKIDPKNPAPDWVDLVAACSGNKCPGVIVRKEKNPVENFVQKITADKIKKAGLLAKQQGYTISVRSKCRSTATQIAWAEKSPQAVKNGTIAKPGKSPHGTGLALDVALMQGSKTISDGAFSGSTQCNAEKSGVALLSTIMENAGFIRLGIENWHFEALKAGSYCRMEKYTGVSPCIPPASGAERCPLTATKSNT